MFEHIAQFHDSLPTLLRWTVDFTLNVVLLRGILANEILQEIRQRGWLKQGILHSVMNRIKEWTVIARKMAIIEHYRGGHQHDIRVGCSQGRCGIFSHA